MYAGEGTESSAAECYRVDTAIGEGHVVGKYSRDEAAHAQRRAKAIRNPARRLCELFGLAARVHATPPARVIDGVIIQNPNLFRCRQRPRSRSSETQFFATGD